MSLKMAYFQIIGLKADLLPVVQTLHRLGYVQIDNSGEASDLGLSPLHAGPEEIRAREELSLQFMKVKGLLDTLGVREGDCPAEVTQADIADFLAGIATLTPRVQALTSRREKLQAETELLPHFEGILRKLLPLLPPTARDPANALLGLLVSRAHVQTVDLIRDQVQALTGGKAEIMGGDVDQATHAVLLVIPEEYAAQVSTLLDDRDISRLRLPSGLGGDTPDKAIAALRGRLQTIPEEIAAIGRELDQIAAEWSGRLLCLRAALQDQLDVYDTLASLSQTEKTFVLIGWAPARQTEAIRAALRDEFGERVLVNELPLSKALKKRAPVALENPVPARPFESLVNLFSPPPYEGTDPTRLMAFFLPLFFGMMLGDIAYGLILLALTVYLRFRLKPGVMRDVVTILAIGSGWAILFGFLFGEAFGSLGEHFGLHPLLFDRANSAYVVSLLLLSIGIGAAHITLGLCIGVWEGIRQRSKSHLLERGGKLIGLIGLFAIVGVLVDFLPDGFMTPAVAALLVGIALLAGSLGWIGILLAPIEFLSLIGNVLSYLRIAAIGLASVYLALVANEFAGSLGSLVVGVIIAVLLHALNVALGAFSPTIHSLRLHYVEFFRTFYEGGGKLFKPFSRRIVVRD